MCQCVGGCRVVLHNVKASSHFCVIVCDVPQRSIVSMRSCCTPASSGLKLISSLQRTGVDRIQLGLWWDCKLRFETSSHLDVGRHGQCKERFLPSGFQRTYELTEHFPKALPLSDPPVAWPLKLSSVTTVAGQCPSQGERLLTLEIHRAVLPCPGYLACPASLPVLSIPGPWLNNDNWTLWHRPLACFPQFLKPLVLPCTRSSQDKVVSDIQ